MGLFGCSHDWEVTSEKYTPADDTEIELPNIRDFLLPGRRKKVVAQAFTEIAVKCKKCNTTKTSQSVGYKPPSHQK